MEKSPDFEKAIEELGQLIRAVEHSVSMALAWGETLGSRVTKLTARLDLVESRLEELNRR